jgi:hypothetical protein
MKDLYLPLRNVCHNICMMYPLLSIVFLYSSLFIDTLKDSHVFGFAEKVAHEAFELEVFMNYLH